MGQAQSTAGGGRPIRGESMRIDDSEINIDISKKIKTADESEESASQGNLQLDFGSNERIIFIFIHSFYSIFYSFIHSVSQSVIYSFAYSVFGVLNHFFC